MTEIEKLRMMIREKDFPFFSDEELQFYLAQNSGDLKKTAYECLILKSENTELNVSGLQVGDSSKYFRRLAQKYREYHSGILPDN